MPGLAQGSRPGSGVERSWHLRRTFLRGMCPPPVRCGYPFFSLPHHPPPTTTTTTVQEEQTMYQALECCVQDAIGPGGSWAAVMDSGLVNNLGKF